jgi:hypothetical protein
MRNDTQIRLLARELRKLIDNSQKLKSVTQTGGVIRINYAGKDYEVNSAKRRDRERINRDR